MGTGSAALVETKLYINGKWCASASGKQYDLYNPARPSEMVGRAAAGTAEDVKAAVEAAHRAYPAWAALSYDQRGQFLVKVADELIRDEEDLQSRIRLLTREHGKILKESTMEMTRLGDRFRYAASLADRLATEERLSAPPFDTIITRQPRGVAALIVPWNWPLSILGAKMPQALMAGNTVVIKLSPYAALAPALTIKKMAELFPPGVVNLITSPVAEAGAALVEHPLVRKVNFTGGIETGKKVMRAAASTLKHVTLELGGNDPALVLDDADLGEEALRRIMLGGFLTSGQLCMAIKRIYVHKSRYSELVEGLVAMVDRFVVGDGLDPEVTMGPLNNEAQLKIVRDLVADARKNGAKVQELGQVADEDLFQQGYFHRPTIVTDADPSLSVVTCEQFGPVMPILPCDSDEQAIEMANSTEFGLCSSVWTADPERALRVARKLEAGYTYLNAHGPMAQDGRAPFGGVKQSGIGRELGLEGIIEFQEYHSITAPAGWLPD